jgi:signal transduction histidine kinase
MIVEDDGVGIDSPFKEKHFGIMGMKERAFMIGAGIDIVSKPGGGTAVIVELKCVIRAMTITDSDDADRGFRLMSINDSGDADQ